MAVFPCKPGSAGSPSGPPPPPVPEENLCGLLEWCFYRVDVLPVTQPSVSKHWREHKALTVIWWALFPSALRHCWLGGRKGIRPVKNGGYDGGGHWLVRMEWRPAGWSVCLPLLIFPCTTKSKFSSGTGSPGWPRKNGCKTVVVVFPSMDWSHPFFIHQWDD